ncbi:sensor histidine kinase [Lysobacter tyrosinilyticus]
MWKRIREWLANAPITDPVDRRNAPVMQLLLLFYGLLLPANWAWRLASGGEINEARMLIFAIDMLIAAMAWVSIAMIRRGRFRPAIMLFLALQLISLEIVFFRTGVLSQAIDPAPTMLTLVISGLVLGRRALWIAYGLLMCVFATGFMVEVNQALKTGIPIGVALVNVPAVLISYGLITIILDRSIKALRESLSEANEGRRQLQHEMLERERAQSQLIHAQKMEASGRLASGIAHDFSNILDVVLGFARQRHHADELGSAHERAMAMQESLEGVEVAAQRGVTITRKLLTFSRRDVLLIEVFDAAQALLELRPLLRQMFPPSVRLELEPGDMPVPVRLDRSEFELMLLNIAANARDAMPDGGAFIGRVALTHGRVEIALADTGRGMDEQVRARIFEPFFSTKQAGEGTGLGLAVTRDLVKAVGGEIEVESTPGQGTCFRIRLPLADAPPA